MSKRAPKPRSPLRLLFKVIGAMVLVFVIGAGVAMFISWRLANQAPEWWHPLSGTDPQVDTTARSVENTITEQMHRQRPVAPASASGAGSAGTAPSGAGAGTWTITITDAQANAWLAARLVEWLANRNEGTSWPANASDPQLSFEDGIVRLGIEVTDGLPGSKGRVVSAAIAPSIDADGALWVRLDGLAIGRFGVPGSVIASGGGSMLESRLPSDIRNNAETKNFLQALSGRKALTSEPVMKLSDGRKVRIVRITPRAGSIEVECRTLPR